MKSGVLLVRCALVAGVLLACSVSAHASVIFYTTQGTFNAAVTSPTLVEDFESIATKDVPLASLTHNGITYTPLGGTTNVFVSSPGYTNYGAGVTQPTTTSILTASGNEDFSAAFTSSTFAVGFDVYLNGLGAATVNVFNGATLLDTFTFASGNDKRYLGIVSTVAITSFRWTATLGGELNTGIDNISTATVSSVPEPSAMLLLGSGLIALIARRKLNRAS